MNNVELTSHQMHNIQHVVKNSTVCLFFIIKRLSRTPSDDKSVDKCVEQAFQKLKEIESVIPQYNLSGE